ncbi:MAG: TonB-dependent receptor [Phycisphaerales bacterium]
MCLLTAAANAQQQTGTIRGVIYDKDFDAPLALAQVLVSETGQKITAAEQGNYVIEGVLPGTYTLVFSKDGYVRQVKSNVVVQPGQLTDVDAQLSGQFEDMDEFVVQDVRIGGGTEKDIAILRQDSSSFLNGISADTISKSGVSNAADALKLISGTTVQEGKFAVVRGMPDRYVNSQLNGVRLPSADDKTRAVELDQFPSAVIDNIQVSKTFTPDQQGDASGGAVNVVLKGVPQETILQFSSSIKYNTQTTGRSDFLTYKGGGVNYFGFNENREIQGKWLSPRADSSPGSPNDGLYDGAVGVSRGEAPIDYKWGLTAGGNHEFDNGVKLGGLGSFFYERNSSFYDNGVKDEYVATSPNADLTPRTAGDPFNGGSTSLFDVTQSTQEVKWGGLGVLGLETEHHQLKMVYLYTRAAEDKVTLSEDTRGNAYYFPNDPGSLDSTALIPFRRGESLTYTERTTQTLQFSGKHVLPIFETETDTLITLLPPEIDWACSLNEATFDEPDKRFFDTAWIGPFPGVDDGIHSGITSGASTTLGNLQRIFRNIKEDGRQYQVNLKLPFSQWTDTQGYLKAGIFKDEVEREYKQDSFSNFSDNGATRFSPFDDYWSEIFPDQVHYVTQSLFDMDYKGTFDVDAVYWMAEVPLTPTFKLIGGVRYEDTKITTQVDPDRNPDGSISAIYWPPPPNPPVPIIVTPGAANVNFQREDVLPAVSFVWDVFEPLTLRGAFAKTVARQTFRELTPIQQQEYVGGEVFVGNPTLQMASLNNYDLRLDYKPFEGSLYSVSYFYKDITNPIEYIQRSGAFTYTTPVNYSKGKLTGIELEVRQDLGAVFESLNGVTIGGNATLIDSEVILPESEIKSFTDLGYPRVEKRDATNAPAYLYNIFCTYNQETTQTEFSVFYTVRGDTLVAGAGIGGGGYIPDVYETEYGTLNVGITQKIGEYIKLKFQAKNLLDPEIKSVYRYKGQDTVRSSYTKGIDFSFGISAEFKF